MLLNKLQLQFSTEYTCYWRFSQYGNFENLQRSFGWNRDEDGKLSMPSFAKRF
jgi:hypothetical protein